jgi:outer membrane protein TolC
MMTALLLALVWLSDGGLQASASTITLEDAIARGLANSQRVAEMQARREAAEAAEAGRAAASLPTVALGGGYTRTNHVQEFGIGSPGQPTRILYPDLPDNYGARLALNWPVYSGGRNDALERAAAAERHAAGEDLDAARADLRLEITRAFWAVVTARETERVLARSIESVDAHVRDLRTRLQQGLIPPNEVLTAEAQQARQRVLAIEAHNARAISEADLKRLIGSDGPEPLEPAASFAAAPSAPGGQEELVAQARAARPERRALAERAAASRARENAVHAAARPQLGVNAGFDYARPNPHIFPRRGIWQDSWDVSANVTWLLWDGGRRRAEEAEAAANTHALDARAGEIDRQITFEVRQRWFEVDSNRAAIDAAADGIRSATEARRVVGERFAAGVATSTDVLDAELAVLQAELDFTRAHANTRIALARLDRAVGK